MSKLTRTRQGKFKIEESYSINDIEKGNYKLITITDVLKDKNCVIIDDNLYNVIKNGGLISNSYNKEMVTFLYNGKAVAIYKVYDKDNTKMKPYKMFL